MTRLRTETTSAAILEAEWLECVEALTFSDGRLEPPTIVRVLPPTHAEQQGRPFSGSLAEDEKRDIDQREPRRWVVIDWRDLRRRVPLRAFRRLP